MTTGPHLQQEGIWTSALVDLNKITYHLSAIVAEQINRNIRRQLNGCHRRKRSLLSVHKIATPFHSRLKGVSVCRS